MPPSPIDAPPPIQVLVCVNQRPAGSELPCCADSGGQQLYEQLHAITRRLGLVRQVYVTRTLCLAWCSAEGVTVVIHPSRVWLRHCQPADAEQIFATYVQPLLAARRVGD